MPAQVHLDCLFSKIGAKAKIFLCGVLGFNSPGPLLSRTFLRFFLFRLQAESGEV